MDADAMDDDRYFRDITESIRKGMNSLARLRLEMLRKKKTLRDQLSEDDRAQIEKSMVGLEAQIKDINGDLLELQGIFRDTFPTLDLNVALERGKLPVKPDPDGVSRPKARDDYDSRVKYDALPKLKQSASVAEIILWKEEMDTLIRTRTLSSQVIKTMMSDCLEGTIKKEIPSSCWEEGVSFKDMSTHIFRAVLGAEWRLKVEESLRKTSHNQGESFRGFFSRMDQYWTALDLDMNDLRCGVQRVSLITHKLPTEVLRYLYYTHKEYSFFFHTWSYKKFRENVISLDADPKYKDWLKLHKIQTQGAQKQKGSSSSKKYCHFCKQRGHRADECPRKKKKSKAKEGEQGSKSGWVPDPQNPGKEVYVMFDRSKKPEKDRKLSDMVCAICKSQGKTGKDIKHLFDKCPYVNLPQGSSPSGVEGSGAVQGFSRVDVLWMSQRDVVLSNPLWVDPGSKPEDQVSYLKELQVMQNGLSAAEMEMDQYAIGLRSKGSSKEELSGKKLRLPRVTGFLSQETVTVISEAAKEEGKATSPASWKEYTNKFAPHHGHIPVPLVLGNFPVLATFDTGATRMFATRSLWDLLEGKLTLSPIEVTGINSVRQEKYAKDTRIYCGNYIIKGLVYPTDCAVDMLLSREAGERVGIKVIGAPTTFPSLIPRSDDQEWVKEEMFEEPWSEEVSQVVTKAIEGPMRDNIALPVSTFCSMPRAEFKIQLKKDVLPVFTRQYPIPEALVPKVAERAHEWLSSEWIELLKNPPDWCSPLLAAKKISGGVVSVEDIRLCMDFRVVNSCSEEPEYRVPLVRSLLSKLIGKKYFTELDLASAYHQIVLSEDSRELTCFQIPKEGFARWKRMFFGAKGAVTHFQLVMETVMGELDSSITVVVYVDNIVIASNILEEHIKDVREVITLLTRYGFKLRLSKCKFALKSLKFMGSIIDGSRRAVDPQKVAVFREMKQPRRGKEVSSLLGFVNYLREYIPLYSCIFGPLEGLRSKRVISDQLWRESGGEKALEIAKRILSEAPILHSPDFSKVFYIETDASQYGVGAILFQMSEKGAPIYVDFAAKALNSAQSNYSSMKRELLAGMYAMETWRSILLFRKFFWGMDNQALTYINVNKSRVILDWAMLFQEFDFETHFKRGVLNVLPHNLSHLYAVLDLDFGTGPMENPVSKPVYITRLVGHDVKDLKLNFGDVSAFFAGRGSLVLPTFTGRNSSIIQSLGKECPEDEDERKDMVKKCHEANHVGAKMMFKMIFNDGYYWPTLFEDCERAAKGCISCLRYNIQGGGFHPMSTISAKRPFDHVVWDLIGKFKTSDNGYNFVLIIVDVVTRFVLLIPVRSKMALEICLCLLNMCANFGVPFIIQSDNDRALLNKVMEQMRAMAGFKFRNIMAYFPRTNGLVERYVQETKQLLYKVIKGDHSGWDLFIPAIQMSLNDRVVSRHNSRPFSLMFGRRFNGFQDYRKVEFEEGSEKLWIDNALKWGNDVWDVISKKGTEKGAKQCDRANEKARARNKKEELKVGDVVMKIRQKRTSKMAERWEGPFVIFEKSKRGYRLREDEGKMLKNFFPIEHLKLIEQVLKDIFFFLSYERSLAQLVNSLFFKREWSGSPVVKSI